MARDWNAPSYHRISAPMEGLARQVLERLELDGGETVLDAGCGTGRVTAVLADRLPRGRVIGLDLSASMVREAARSLDGRAPLVQADLLRLPFREAFEVVFSTATFHWVLDHSRLFGELFRALRPGGRLVAQCGGEGNIAGVLAAADRVVARPRHAEAFRGWERPSHFASPEETTALLEKAGFVAVRCWLEERPVVPEEPREYLETIVLGPHLQQLGEERLSDFLDEVMELLPEPVTVDYVRLNIEARKPR